MRTFFKMKLTDRERAHVQNGFIWRPYFKIFNMGGWFWSSFFGYFDFGLVLDLLATRNAVAFQFQVIFVIDNDYIRWKYPIRSQRISNCYYCLLSFVFTLKCCVKSLSGNGDVSRSFPVTWKEYVKRIAIMYVVEFVWKVSVGHKKFISKH